MADLRAYVFLDRVQPQFAGYVGTVTSGDLLMAGMSALYLEVSPGNDVFRLVDVAVKAADVRLGAQLVEREFGLLELHSFDQSAVRLAGQTILDHLGRAARDAQRPELTSTERITNVHPYQAQLLNRRRRGSLMLAGDSLVVVECQPAAYINLAANEAEKAAAMTLVDVASVGRYGRLWLAGREADVQAAQSAALAALDREPGR
jgi:ethanolamine utilization microcompartment shell protein EutL